jgi:WD40 repeat protein
MDGRVSWLRGPRGSSSSAALSVSLQGPLVLAAHEDGSARVWDLRSGRQTRALVGEGGPANHALLGRDARDAFVARGARVARHDLRSDRVVLQASSCDDGAAKSAAAAAVAAAAAAAAAVAATPATADAGKSATSSSSTTTTAAAAAAATAAASEFEINEIDVHSDGQHVVCADDSGAVRVLKFSGAPQQAPQVRLRVPQAHDNIVSTVAFRPGHDWQSLCSGGFDCRLRELSRGTTAAIVVKHSEAGFGGQEGLVMTNPPFVNSASYSPDGRWLALAVGDGTLAVLDADNATAPRGELLRHTAHLAAACQVVAQPAALLSAGNDQAVRLWKLTDVPRRGAKSVALRLLWELPLPQGNPNRVAFLGGTLCVAQAGSPDILVLQPA